jgi:hypothetical protein
MTSNMLVGLSIISWLLVVSFIFWRRNRSIDIKGPFSAKRVALALLLSTAMTSTVAAMLTGAGAPKEKLLAVLLLYDASGDTLLFRYGLSITYLLSALIVILPTVKRPGDPSG